VNLAALETSLKNLEKMSGDKDKLNALVVKTYKEQAVWFLNAFWDTFAAKEAENIWTRVIEMIELDHEKKKRRSST